LRTGSPFHGGLESTFGGQAISVEQQTPMTKRSMIRLRFASLVAFCAWATPTIVWAQPLPEAPVPAPDLPQTTELETRIQALEERTKKAEARATANADALAALQADIARRDADAQKAAEAAGQDDGKKASEPVVTFGGYAEVYYQWNVNDPSNRITNYRGYDNRHNTFTISNAALDAQFAYEGAQARVTLQAGQTPDTYYSAEPVSPGASGAGASTLDTWRFVQQAYVGYEFPVLSGLLLQGGIFLSPIGPESIAVKDNWQWSRSNLFFGLPAYHTGARATLKASKEWAITLGVVNGWNSVVDNNPEKSGYAQLTYGSDDLSWSLLYFGGIERPDAVPEGDPWRSTFDTHLTWNATPWLKLQPHFDAGFEPTDFGTSFWVAGALAAQAKLTDWLFAAVRTDAFYEKAASSPSGDASRIFWPVDWVTSQTATLEARAADHVSIRLEYRHDHAAGDMFFAGDVVGDGAAAPFVADARYQNTFTALR